jgi:hypothetical protein
MSKMGVTSEKVRELSCKQIFHVLYRNIYCSSLNDIDVKNIPSVSRVYVTVAQKIRFVKWRQHDLHLSSLINSPRNAADV